MGALFPAHGRTCARFFMLSVSHVHLSNTIVERPSLPLSDCAYYCALCYVSLPTSTVREPARLCVFVVCVRIVLSL